MRAMNSLPSSLALATAVSLAALAGCASTAPLSFIEGVPWTRTDPSLYPVRVVSVDAHIEFEGASKPVMVSPGVRSLVLEAAPGEGVRHHVQRTYAMRIEPCTHYYLAARKSSALASEWTLVVDRKEPVPGCDVKDELRKAGNLPAS